MRFTRIMLSAGLLLTGGFFSASHAQSNNPQQGEFVKAESVENLKLSETEPSPLKGQITLKRGWHHSYEDGMAEAKRSGKPVVLHFYATWCAPCKLMEQNVLNTQTVTSLLGNKIIGIKINVDQYSQLKGQYGVSRFPSDVYIKADGTVIRQTSGRADANSYAATLVSIAATNTTSTQQQIVKATVVSRKVRQDDKTIGLKGFSPVSLSRNEKWQKGMKKHAWNYAGIVYYLVNEKEYQEFKTNPAKYAPRLKGCDPTIFSSDHQRITEGSIQHTVFFNGGVYLFKSKQNLSQFMETPWKYSVQDQMVSVPSENQTNSMQMN